MTQANERSIKRTAFSILTGLILLGAVCYVFRGVLVPVLLAFLLAYVFAPLVRHLTRYRFSPALASLLCLLLLFLFGLGLITLIVPTFQDEIQAVAQKMPAYLETIRESVVPWIESTFGVELPKNINEALITTKEQIIGRAGELAGPLASLLNSVLSSTLSLLASLVHLIIIPLFTYYFLKDYPKIIGWFVNLIPLQKKEQVLDLLGEIDGVLSGFLRGQLIICTILAAIYSLLLSLAGVPAGITIGVVSGLFNLVPYLGTATGMSLSGVFLLLEGAPWTSYLVMAAIFGLVSVIDGLFITPRVLGKKLGLAPVAVILVVLAFGEVFGFTGVLMAVPLTAVGRVIVKRALEVYRKSRAYTGPIENKDKLPVEGVSGNGSKLDT